MSFLTNTCTVNTLLAFSGTFILANALLWFALFRGGGRFHRRAAPVMLVGLLALGLAGGAGAVVAGQCRGPAAAGCPSPRLVLSRDLLADSHRAPGANGASLATWVISGTATTVAAPAPAGIATTAGTDLFSARVRVHSGAQYCYQATIGGSGHGQVGILWDDASLKQVAFSAQPPQPTGQAVQAAAAAPPGATYARLLLRALDGAPEFRNQALAETGVHIDPWPNGARAALAFSFDWESAMGGLIHSKSGHDQEYARTRGLNMRVGADTLLGFFQAAHIGATFYGTGYNLLDGNTEHRQFAGNLLYKWGAKQGWATTWWFTNTWYSDDPYGTIASDPAWYFGDQADRLQAAGQEIASHTFGHLYVRGTTPAELSADLDAWAQAAAARHLPPVRSLAFPWQSSNSLTPEFYKVLAEHGIGSVTRVYPPDLCRNAQVCDRYDIRASPVYSPVLIMPDFQLGVTGPDNAEGGANVVTSTIQAQAVISGTIARGGVTSFWNHPEVMTLPGVREVWRDTITAAAQARDRHDLWIAPVSTIVQWWRDIDQLDVSWTPDPRRVKLTVVNRSPDPLDGVRLTAPPPAQMPLGADGAPAPVEITVPHLAPGQQWQLDEAP